MHRERVCVQWQKVAEFARGTLWWEFKLFLSVSHGHWQHFDGVLCSPPCSASTKHAVFEFYFLGLKVDATSILRSILLCKCKTKRKMHRKCVCVQCQKVAQFALGALWWDLKHTSDVDDTDWEHCDGISCSPVALVSPKTDSFWVLFVVLKHWRYVNIATYSIAKIHNEVRNASRTCLRSTTKSCPICTWSAVMRL